MDTINDPLREDPLHALGDLRRPLEALGTLLDAAGERHHLLVVGGVAILVRLIRNRVTGDVDVIARGEFDAGGDFHLIPPDPMPDVLHKSIERVGRDFEMPPNWLNTVIGSQWLAGTAPLPPGLKSETTWYAIGGLQLGIAGRRALVH